MQTDGYRPHVVVIDHTPEILTLIQELLLSESYRVTTMNACPDSPDCLAELRPDVIIHDYTPVTTQADLTSLRRLTTDPRTRHMPIAICSAAPDVEDMAAELTSPTVRVVRKPFALDDLLAAVAAGLGVVPIQDSRPELQSSTG